MALVDTVWYLNFGDGSTTGHYAVAKRPQNAAVAAGQIVRQFTAPTVGNERVFVCIIAGTTANVTDATWVLTRGAKTTDGTATWQECTGQAALNGDLTNTATWTQVKAATPAVLGQIIKRSNNASYQICTTAGAMSASEPAFSNTAGVTTTDTTAVWTSLGVVGNFTGGQAPHARLNNVFATNWFASGNAVYVGDNHAETSTGIITLGPSSALMAKILCHNRSGSYPPAASDITTGATITSTTALTITAQGSFYFYGLKFVTPSNQMNIGGSGVGQTQNWYYFDTCAIEVSGAGATIAFAAGGTSTAWAVIVFNNTTIKLSAVGQSIRPYFVNFTWQNTGQILAAGSSIPTNLFAQDNTSGRFANITLNNLDLSQLTGSLFTNASNSSIGTLVVQDCKLNAAMTVTTPINTGMTVQLIRSDSAATAYKSSRYQYEGTETTETAIVRTGGAVDPTGQAQSRKIITTANTQWLRPFKAEPYAIWNSTTGANVTVTVCGTVNAGAVPNNDDIWLEVEYLGDAGSATVATWNPADLSGITLTGSNLIATGGNFTGVRGNLGKSSDKLYFEITVTTMPSGFVGLAKSTVDLTSGGTVGAVGISGAGAVEVNGVSSGVSIGSIGGLIAGIAVDLSSNLIWFRAGASGNWNGSSGNNPATGTGGISISAVAGTLFPFFMSVFGGTQTVTANFGSSAFAGTVPSGFTSGWGIAGSPSPLGKFVTTTKASVLASNAAVSSDSSSWNNLPYTTFDGTQTGVTMSNGNRTVTHNSGTSDQGAISSTFVGAGKFYFEITIVQISSTANNLGIILQGGTFINAGSGFNTASVFQSGSIYNHSGNTGKLMGNYIAGDIVCAAIDFDARLAWFRKNNGNWNGDAAADPVTGTGGVTIIAGLFAPFVRYGAGTTTSDAYTGNFGQSAFTYTAPAGFGNWSLGWSPFKLTATLSSPQPQLAGYLHARVRVAKASTTYYIDPQVTLT